MSIYLDLLRFTAAAAVFLGHAGGLIFPAMRHGFLFQQEDNAVAVFFVLSGFVISHVVWGKERDFRSYFVARASRIYSVAILALVITAVCDRIGAGYNPGYYGMQKFYHPETVAAAIRCLTFTNELWFSHSVFGTNEPYWSLGFEVWYYAWFAAICFLSGKLRVVAAVLWFVLCGPKIGIYLPLWLIGVVAHRHTLRGNQKLGFVIAVAGIFLSVIVYVCISAFLSPLTLSMFFIFDLPNLEFASFVNFTLIGVLVYINIVAFDALAGDKPFWPRAAANGIRWLAGASFTLYLLNQPILMMISSLFPAVSRHLLLGLCACSATFVLILGAAELGERRKKIFARFFGKLVGSGRDQFKPVGVYQTHVSELEVRDDRQREEG
jgi:peptidoglycan/LPS O-acetylase OafA/YrhL